MSADAVLPFRIEGQNINGRIVRLADVTERVIAARDYPPPIARLIGEALALAAMLGTLLKYQGRFVLQISSDGAVRTLMVDYASGGKMRALAQYDAEAVAQNAALLGEGHLALTVDQGADMERYQGIVPLVDGCLTASALAYFAQSEQIATAVKLVAAPSVTPDGARWLAAGIMVQQAPETGGTGAAARHDDDWQRVQLLLQTTSDDELLDFDLAAPQLAHRLFHEDGVRVFTPRAVCFHCPCSRERVQNMLAAMPERDRAEMKTEKQIEIVCEFCATAYHFTPQMLDENAR